VSRADPGVITVRPFTLDDLEEAADFCDRARLDDPGIEPFAQRLALIATGPRAMLPLWQVAEGEDGLLHGIAFAAVREQRESANVALGKVESHAENVPPVKATPVVGVVSRPPRQPYAGMPNLGALAGSRVGKSAAVLPVAPERPQGIYPKTLQPAKPREPLVLKPARPPEPQGPLVSQSLGSNPSGAAARGLSSNTAASPSPTAFTSTFAQTSASTNAPLAAIKPLRTTLEIYVAVAPQLRRQSLGRALLEPLMQWVQAAQEPVALRARVNDLPDSRAGLSFLKALGFSASVAQLTLSWAQGPIAPRELPALSLRQLAPGDSAGLQQLSRLTDAAWAGAPDAFQTRADELAQLMSELGRLVILASADGRGVGYLSGVWLGKTLGIEEVAVLPDYRRAGVGRALVTFALQQNARAAILSVSEENRAARAMYRALGFKETARKLILTLAGGPPV
jgi:ribosomal protein S18 acetylase RimI-like enzyme